MDPSLEVFNTPPLDFSCERREVSTVTPQVFSLLNSENSYKRSLALAKRVIQEVNELGLESGSENYRASIVRGCFVSVLGREPKESEIQDGLRHWEASCKLVESSQIQLAPPPLQVTREAIEENTGERFAFQETIYSNADFVPDLIPQDCDLETRALAELCLVLFNSNELIFVY
jgi:hypothetical protein